MKKLLNAFAALSVLFAFASCNSDSSSVNRANLYGVWDVESETGTSTDLNTNEKSTETHTYKAGEMQWAFFSDGTGYEAYQNGKYKNTWTWKLNGKKLTMVFDEDEDEGDDTFTISSLTSSKLVVTQEGTEDGHKYSDTVTLKKISE